MQQKKLMYLLLLAVVGVLLPVAASAATTIGTNVAVAGTLSVDGITTLTGAVTLSSTLTVTGDVTPAANNTYNLGAFGTAWKTIYASTSLVIGGTGLAGQPNTAAITGHLSGIVALVNIPDAASNTFKCTSSTLTFSGAAVGDTVVAMPQSYDPAFSAGSLTPYIVTANNVDLVYCSGGGVADSDPASMSYRIDVWKH